MSEIQKKRFKSVDKLRSFLSIFCVETSIEPHEPDKRQKIEQNLHRWVIDSFRID